MTTNTTLGRATAAEFLSQFTDARERLADWRPDPTDCVVVGIADDALTLGRRADGVAFEFRPIPSTECRRVADLLASEWNAAHGLAHPVEVVRAVRWQARRIATLDAMIATMRTAASAS